MQEAGVCIVHPNITKSPNAFDMRFSHILWLVRRSNTTIVLTKTKAMNMYRQLELWKSALQVGVIVHRISKAFPPEADEVLISELRKNALKISTRLAEGYFRGSEVDLGQYIEYSQRHCAVVDTLLTIGLELQYMTEEEYAIVQGHLYQHMHSMEDRQPVPWSPLDNGWHYEPEEESESHESDE